METGAPPDFDFEIPEYDTKFTYEAPGPKFVDLLHDKKPRNNRLSSTFKPDQSGSMPATRGFTEREGLKNLDSYFKHVETELQKVNGADVEEMKTMLTAFRDNLVFIGEPELETALGGMAQHVIDYARGGKFVYLLPYGDRSEKYITLRLLEQIDATLEKEPELSQRIKLPNSRDEISSDWNDQMMEHGNADIKVVLPDDFIISGSTHKGVMRGICKHFTDRRIGNPEEFLETLIVASPIRQGDTLKSSLQHGSLTSYYGISEILTTEGKFAVNTGIVITGSHASADYSFDAVVDNFQEFLKKKSLQVPETPFLYKVNRIYDNKGFGSSEYINPELQQRWNKMERKYGIYHREKQ